MNKISQVIYELVDDESLKKYTDNPQRIVQASHQGENIKKALQKPEIDIDDCMSKIGTTKYIANRVKE